MKKIKFGTDGWRAVAGKDFTLGNLRVVIQAITDYLGQRLPGGDRVLCGYDTRFMSEHYATAAAEVCCANGFRAVLSDRPLTTPTLSYAVTAERAVCGLMITASHNPFWFGGLKFKECSGGSAAPETTAGIEVLLGRSGVKSLPFDDATAKGLAVKKDIIGLYIERLGGLFKADLLKDAPGPVLFDCMHGASGVFLRDALAALGLQAEITRERRDPYFGGMNPDPLPENLSAAAERVRAEGFTAAFAFDGDGDRVGVLDEDGRPLMPYQVMSLLITHLVKNRMLSGSVVKTVSSSSLIDRVADDFGLKVREVPVGFKHISGFLESGEALIGGEENGGFGFSCHIPERDGLISALMLLEMTAVEGKTIKQLMAELEGRHGRVYHRRQDGIIKPARRENILDEIAVGAEGVYSGYGVEGISRTDGLKVMMRDGSWVLFRASGTEPLLRIYSEAKDPATVEKLISAGREAFLG